jgi:adenylate kinase
MSRVLVITGSPGTGKTTISRLLAEELRGSHLDLGDIALREGFISGRDKRRRTFIADLRRLRSFITRLLKERADEVFVIEGHYASDVVPREMTSTAIVLRCDPDELKRRLEESGVESDKVLENAAAEVLDICLGDAVKAYGTEKVCEVDTTGKAPKEVVDEILSILRGKKKTTLGKFNWLKKLDEEGRLQEFLQSRPANPLR